MNFLIMVAFRIVNWQKNWKNGGYILYFFTLLSIKVFTYKKSVSRIVKAAQIKVCSLDWHSLQWCAQTFASGHQTPNFFGNSTSFSWSAPQKMIRIFFCWNRSKFKIWIPLQKDHFSGHLRQRILYSNELKFLTHNF